MKSSLNIYPEGMRKCKEKGYNKPSNLGILKNNIKIIKDEN